MNARELEALMAEAFGEDWRGKAIVGPLGVFHLGDAFAECGLEDPRAPAVSSDAYGISQQLAWPARPFPVTAADQVAWGLRYIKARYPQHEAVRLASLAEYERTFGLPQTTARRPWWARVAAWMLAKVRR